MSFEHRRNYFFSIGSILAIYFLCSMLYYNIDIFPTGVNMMLAVAILYFIMAGIAHWIGHHLLTVNTSEKKPGSLKVEMARTSQGKELANAIIVFLVTETLDHIA